MKIYLVGGAIRDKILNLPVLEKDYVVVGSSPDEMIKRNYKPVGKDFPVFLHPHSKEEYALARTEKKIGIGYKGFKFYTDPNITLEQDLYRRDLTINAIACDDKENIIDPYGGINDINQKILRHVSDAFSEDPLRILRIARFQAKLIDFKISIETEVLLKKMVANGELSSLSSERVIIEIKKVFKLNHGFLFFQVLEKLSAHNKIFELNNDKKISNLFKPFFGIDIFYKIDFNILWLYLQTKFDFKFKNNFKVSFSKKNKTIVKSFFKVKNNLKKIKELNIYELHDLLSTIGFYGNNKQIDYLLELSELDFIYEKEDFHSHQIFLKKLDIYFASNNITIPRNLSNAEISNYLDSERLKLLESFNFH